MTTFTTLPARPRDETPEQYLAHLRSLPVSELDQDDRDKIAAESEPESAA